MERDATSREDEVEGRGGEGGSGGEGGRMRWRGEEVKEGVEVEGRGGEGGSREEW